MLFNFADNWRLPIFVNEYHLFFKIESFSTGKLHRIRCYYIYCKYTWLKKII